MGLRDWRLYHRRTHEAVPKRELREIREKADQVPSLESKLREANSDAARTGLQLKDYKRSSDEALVIEKGARQSAERESDRLTRLVQRFSQVTRPLFEALGIQAVPTEATDPNASSLPTLENELTPLLPYVKLLRDRDNRGTVITAVSIEEQRRMHVPYHGQEAGEYAAALVKNTNFDNEKSILTSAELMARDLREISSGRLRLSNPWPLLETLATYEGSVRIVKAAGQKVFDAFFEAALPYSHENPRQLFDTAFNEHVLPHVSNSVKTKVALARLQAMTESEYDQLPDVILKAQGAIDPKEAKERLKVAFIKTLYAGNASMLRALSSHSVLVDVMGESYTLNALISEAANRVPLTVKDAKERLGIYENLRQVSQQLQIAFSPEDINAVARNYVADTLVANDRKRFEDAKRDPIVIAGIKGTGILDAVQAYVAQQTVPKSGEEAAFSTQLFVDSEKDLRERLGEHTFATIFGRHSKFLDLDQLLSIKSQPLYENAQVKAVLNEQIGQQVGVLFGNLTAKKEEQSERMTAVVQRAAELPYDTRKILLTKILDSNFIDPETRLHYMEKVLPHLEEADRYAAFDTAIRGTFQLAVGPEAWRLQQSFGRPVRLLEERAKLLGTDNIPDLLTEIVTAKNMPAEHAVWVLDQLTDKKILRDLLPDEARAAAFGKYINYVQSTGTRDLKETQEKLDALVNSHAHLFLKAIVEQMLDIYFKESGLSYASVQTRSLQKMLDNVRIPLPELGEAVAQSVQRVIYDEERGKVKQLIRSDITPIELLIRYAEHLPSERVPNLVNWSLQSTMVASHSHREPYEALKKFDKTTFGSQVNPEVREAVYDAEIRGLAAYLPDQTTRQIVVDMQKVDREYQVSAKIEVLQDFAIREKARLTPKNFGRVFDIYLTFERLKEATKLLQAIPDTATRNLLVAKAVERVEATPYGGSFGTWGKPDTMRAYMSAFEGLLPDTTVEAWTQFLTKNPR